MRELRIGIDVDGILANFNKAYREMLIKVSGRDLIPETFEPPTWNYATVFGYTKEEDAAAWKEITSDPIFWRRLGVLPGAREMLDAIDDARHAVYFITTRPGVSTQHQTETWLRNFVLAPTVLIAKTSEDKGVLARGLGLTHFIDDKPENCLAVKSHIPSCHVYLLDALYNRWAGWDARYNDIVRIYSLDKFARVIEAAERLPVAA